MHHGSMCQGLHHVDGDERGRLEILYPYFGAMFVEVRERDLARYTFDLAIRFDVACGHLFLERPVELGIGRVHSNDEIDRGSSRRSQWQ